MRNFLIAVALVAISSLTVSQPPPPQSGKFGPSAVWQLPPGYLASAHAACDSSQSKNPAECFIDQMAKAGAPADAVTFTRALYKQSHGELGIISSFEKVGPVDVAWVIYPLHQPSNYGLLLINGDPAIVNAEDLKLLDQKGMEQSFQYQGVQNQFPKVGLWPGDRDGQTWPNSQSGPNGGVQFTLGYHLRNGCQTCAHAGFALFNWNFDGSGKFTGTSFQGLTPAPVSGS